MIPNKFRGKRIGTDEYVFGNLYRQGNILKIINREGEYRVEEKSIGQLAGYDKDGNEIYKRAGWTK